MTMRATMKSLSLAVAAVALITLAGECRAATREIGMMTIAKDATWEGDIVITGDVHVPAGITLTIAPGTTVRFRKIAPDGDRNLFGVESPYYPQAEIIVTGRLIARGTAGKPVIFTSAEAKPEPADWGSLNFLGSKGNVIEQCRIEYAYNGVHSHGGQVFIKDNTFVKNAVAISVKKEDEAVGTPGFGIPADITVTGNLVEENKGGINVRISKGVITRNTVRGNKFFGIWIKGKCEGEISRNEITANQKGIFFYKAGGMTIKDNNIFDNIDYNLAIADEQGQDIPAAGNWFGTVDRVKIEELVFDGKADPALARIVVEPFLSERVRDAGR
ncbi:NosD domain-containing protein [Geomobilimonas luticola]|uniref:Right-handed parallel beta-helix repeat-containing protein n=1 Tax=Geomobilimonas luticola TaxID=1114878 RepID=A0ABS5SAC2_9BACT|nr:NosD domain-containing protein [Geomobilimonas luticola]MBT0652316.1 right-handed parallel beta-helix repeat-containing protein [Geomobilimonas luticola]